MKIIKIITIILIGLALYTPAQANENIQIPESMVGIRNYQRFNNDIATSGSLAFSAPKLIKEKGFKTILDLRTPTEGIKTEQQEVKNSGLIYNNLPITSRSAFEDKNVKAFTKLVNEAKKPLLIHCGSGNRVGMLYSQYLINQGMSIENSIKIGEHMGMRPSFSNIIRSKYGVDQLL